MSVSCRAIVRHLKDDSQTQRDNLTSIYRYICFFIILRKITRIEKITQIKKILEIYGMKLDKAVHGGRGRTLTKAGISIIDFSANLNPAPPDLDLTLTRESAGYYPDDSYSDLKQIIADHHHRNPNEICVGNGSAEVIRTLCHTVLSPGMTVYIPQHTFSEYALSARLTGATITHTRQPADLSFLCNPDNPSGLLTPRQEVLAILESVPAGGILCIDEAFIDLADPTHSVSDVIDNRLFVLRSLTKSFACPGVRFGYGIGSPELVERLEVMRPPWTVGAHAEAMAMQAFSRYALLERSRMYIASERDRMMTIIRNLGYTCDPGSANYLLIHTGTRADILTEALIRKGILVRDCTSFGLPDCIRVAVRTADENSRLLEALTACTP